MIKRYGKRLHFEGELGKVDVEIFDGCKYKMTSKVESTVSYDNVVSFAVFKSEDFAPGYLDSIEPDEYDEYIKIELADGKSATFRNSHVYMFLTR